MARRPTIPELEAKLEEELLSKIEWHLRHRGQCGVCGKDIPYPRRQYCSHRCKQLSAARAWRARNPGRTSGKRGEQLTINLSKPLLELAGELNLSPRAMVRLSTKVLVHLYHNRPRLLQNLMKELSS